MLVYLSMFLHVFHRMALIVFQVFRMSICKCINQDCKLFGELGKIFRAFYFQQPHFPHKSNEHTSFIFFPYIYEIEKKRSEQL